MPPIERQGRKQKAVLWERAGYDAYGKYQVSSPVELEVRWEEARKQTAASDNTLVTTDATVFVDREIHPGSIMWKGRLKDWLPTNGNLKEVISYDEIPDLKGRNIQKTVTVARYNELLPTIVS